MSNDQVKDVFSPRKLGERPLNALDNFGSVNLARSGHRGAVDSEVGAGRSVTSHLLWVGSGIAVADGVLTVGWVAYE